MRPNEFMIYGSLVKEYLREYHNIVDSQLWEPKDSKKNYQDEPLLMNDSTMATKYPVNKNVQKVYFKISDNGKDNNSEVG